MADITSNRVAGYKSGPLNFVVQLQQLDKNNGAG